MATLTQQNLNVLAMLKDQQSSIDQVEYVKRPERLTEDDREESCDTLGQDLPTFMVGQFPRIRIRGENGKIIKVSDNLQHSPVRSAALRAAKKSLKKLGGAALVRHMNKRNSRSLTDFFEGEEKEKDGNNVQSFFSYSSSSSMYSSSSSMMMQPLDHNKQSSREDRMYSSASSLLIQLTDHSQESDAVDKLYSSSSSLFMQPPDYGKREHRSSRKKLNQQAQQAVLDYHKQKSIGTEGHADDNRRSLRVKRKQLEKLRSEGLQQPKVDASKNESKDLSNKEYKSPSESGVKAKSLANYFQKVKISYGGSDDSENSLDLGDLIGGSSCSQMSDKRSVGSLKKKRARPRRKTGETKSTVASSVISDVHSDDEDGVLEFDPSKQSRRLPIPLEFSLSRANVNSPPSTAREPKSLFFTQYRLSDRFQQLPALDQKQHMFTPRHRRPIPDIVVSGMDTKAANSSLGVSLYTCTGFCGQSMACVDGTVALKCRQCGTVVLPD